VSIIAAGRPKTRDEWRAQLDQASCAVAVTHRPALFDDGLDVLNEVALATGKPWLTVALLGRVVQIGPLVHPGSTACLACLRLQLQRNASFLYAAGLMDRLSAERDRAAQLGPVTEFVAGLVVSEIARAHAAGQPPLSVGQILTIDTSTLAIDRFKVLKVPRCPVCGPARDRPMMRIWG
jgi:bacteriocin biosynthesis cyclodehydratase domain-containing protein